MLNRTFILLVATCLTGTNLLAADVSFVGKWKINLAKSVITGFPGTIEDVGHGEFKFIFGDDIDLMVMDGKEHPTKYGTERTFTKVGPNHWTTEYKRDGKLTGSDDWRISEDEKTITFLTAGTRADGTNYKGETKFKRTAGTVGLAGTWESTEIDPNNYSDWVIEPFEGDGLAVTIPSSKERHAVKFDGKDYPNEGPRVAPGATTAGKRIDEHTIELVNKLKGKVLDTARIELSADGKTFTLTDTYPGVEKKEIDVYERQ